MEKVNRFLKFFFGKCVYAFMYGLFIGVTYKFLVNRSKRLKRDNITIYKRDLRLSLKHFINFSREQIVGLGRSAIRCPLTGNIMTDPVVNELDGVSYEKSAIINYIYDNGCLPGGNKKIINEQSLENLINSGLYPNRMLKEYIEKISHLNNI
jgi:hypothetical protein